MKSSYNLVTLHVEVQMPVRLREVFRLMVERNVQANSVIYTSLIKGLAAHGKLEDAMEMFEQMKYAELAAECS